MKNLFKLLPIFIFIFILIKNLSSNIVLAEETSQKASTSNKIIKVGIVYDEVRAKIEAFDNLDLKINVKEYEYFKKDKNSKQTVYDLLQIDGNIINKENKIICPFYEGKIMVLYGVIYLPQDNITYYYDLFGNPRYIEIEDEPNDVYPHRAAVYDRKGKLVSVSFYISQTEQYTYSKKGKLLGHWINNDYYNKNGKLKNIKRKLPF